MRKIISILFFCASAHLVQAIDINTVYFRSAGVDIASQKFLLQWKFPNPADTAGVKDILILKLATDEQQNTKLDTIDIISNQATQYVDDDNTCCSPIAYALRLVPKNVAEFSTTTELFRTMQLSAPVLDTCANAIILEWSPYQKLDLFSFQPIASFTNEVRYHIYGYAGGSTFKPDSAVWLATSGSATSFTLPVTQEKKYYHLYVAAVYNNSADTSYSNRTSAFTPMLIRPQYISIDSMLSNGNNTTLRFRIDPNTEYNRFWAEMSNDITGGFTSFAEFTNKFQTRIENSTGNGIVFYRISAVNRCANVTASSPVATTISAAVSSDGSVNNISWNSISYNGYDAYYNVYRTQPAKYAALVGNIAHNSISDDLSQFPDSAMGEKFCYIVEGVTDNASLQVINYVRSSETCNTLTPQVFMPNAIQLDGSSIQNPYTGKSRNLFEPVSNFALDFEMYIYARNGKQIYNGTKPWDGREGNTGEFVGEGTYVYFIKITFANGDRIEKTGNVTVVY